MLTAKSAGRALREAAPESQVTLEAAVSSVQVSAQVFGVGGDEINPEGVEQCFPNLAAHSDHLEEF